MFSKTTISKFVAGASAVLVAGFAIATPLAANADATYGARNFYDTVAPGSTTTEYITFNAGERAEVAAVGNGDIDMYVYNTRGRLVAGDTVHVNPRCVWYPRHTEQYQVVIVNHEAYTATFELLTD